MKTYRAFCQDCGWVGYSYTSMAQAVADGGEHSIEAVEGEPLTVHHHIEIRTGEIK